MLRRYALFLLVMPLSVNRISGARTKGIDSKIRMVIGFIASPMLGLPSAGSMRPQARQANGNHYPQEFA
jgi:hypothetical protein